MWTPTTKRQREAQEALRSIRTRIVEPAKRWKPQLKWPTCEKCGQSKTGIYGGVASCIRCPNTRAVI